MKARHQTVTENDVLSGLREAMQLLFSTPGIRPDSGFCETDYRSEVETPEPGTDDVFSRSTREDASGDPPVYYNENVR